MNQSILKGTGVALVTPFQEDNGVDYAAVETLVNNVIKGGVDFLVALGTTAETPTLSASEKIDIYNAIVTANAGRVPIVIGIGGNGTAETVRQMAAYDLTKAAAILSVAPYYNRPSQEGMYRHFSAIAAATELPVILYNVPARTGCNLLPATVLRLAHDHKNIIGLKDAAGSIPQSMELIQAKPDGFLVLSGDDNLLLSQMAIGMDGIISVAANCFTKEVTDIVNMALVGKFDKARKVHYRILPGMDLLFAEGNPAGVKAVLHALGVCKNVLRLPMIPASDALTQRIAEYLNR